MLAGNTASFEEISQRWRAVGNTVSHFTDPRFEPRTSRSRDELVTTRPTGRLIQIKSVVFLSLQQFTGRLSPFLALSDDLLRCVGNLTLSPRAAVTISHWIFDVIQRHQSSSLLEDECKFEVDRKVWLTDGVSELLHHLGSYEYSFIHTSEPSTWCPSSHKRRALFKVLIASLSSGRATTTHRLLGPTGNMGKVSFPRTQRRNTS